MNHDREGKHRPLAQPAAGGEAAPPLGTEPIGLRRDGAPQAARRVRRARGGSESTDPAEGGAEHGLRGGTSDGGEDSRGTRPEALGGDLERLLEFLAFAEGRFLTIHPFRDFNGRTIRLFLSELLRRLDLPEVNLAPEPEQERQRYFTALEAADALDWEPLITLWNERLAASEAN